MSADPRRATVTISFLLAALASAYFLQSVFTRSDHEKARRITREWSAGGDTIEGAILRRNPGASVAWSTQVTSGCYGTVRVTALVVPPGGAPVAEHLFEVDIPRLRVHSLNAAGKADLDEVARTARPTAHAGAAP